MLVRVVPVVLLVCALALAAGCGKKGPLYIPQDSATGVPVVAAVALVRADGTPG